MKLPRNLDADTLVRHLGRRWGYRVARQTGSHIQLRTESGAPHRITVPNHSPLKAGTLSAILKDLVQHHGVSAEQVLEGL